MFKSLKICTICTLFRQEKTSAVTNSEFRHIFFRGDDVYREERIVGHLPKYISRFAWYFIEHGGAITAEVTGPPTFSRDLPQGGRHVPALLEFRCEDEQLLSKCKELVAENLSGLFGNPLIADKSLLVDCANESDSDDDEYDVENNGTGTTENEQTGSAPNPNPNNASC